MICKLEDHTRILKYVDPITGRTQILQRFEGQWVEWGSVSSGEIKSSELKIAEKGGILKETVKRSSDQDIPSLNIKKDEEFLMHSRYILDFEFVTRITEMHITRMDGTPLVTQDEEYHPTNPRIREWSCELHH